MKRLLVIVSATILLLGTAGCGRKLVGTTVTGSALEHGLPAGKDFPGGTVTLSASSGEVQTVTLGRGQTEWKMACKPGQYELSLVSEGRVRSRAIDTRNGSQNVALNFEEVVIYGDIQLDGVGLESLPRAVARGIGTVTLELAKNGTVVDRKEMAGSYEYKFVVPSGLYTLRAAFGTQKVELPVNGTLSTQRVIDLARTATLHGTVRELGLAPGADWPGGSLRVENLDGIRVDELPITAGQDTYEIPVKAGIYRVIAESAGRVLDSGALDLSEQNVGTFALNFDQVVLHGPLVAEAAVTPGGILTISKGGTIVRKVSLLQGDTDYHVVLAPDRYDLEIQVPSTGGLMRESVDLSGRSRCVELNLHKKVTITGQVTENGLKPDPEAFPAGEVVLRTSDGIVRDAVALNPDGTFHAQVYSSDYSLEATSAGRSRSISVDATTGNKAVSANYTDLVLCCTLELNGQALPVSFPAADVMLVGPVTKSAGSISGTKAVFQAVIPAGVYTSRIMIRNTSVEAGITIGERLQRSTKKVLDIGQSIARISGQVSTPIGTPTCQAIVKLYQAGQPTLRAAFTCDSSYRYDAFVNPGSYDIVLEGSKYDTRKYKDVYVNGELMKDLEFKTVTVTLGFNQKPGLGGDAAMFSATYDRYDDKFANPVSDSRVVYRDVFRISPFYDFSLKKDVHVTIGEPLYIFISHGFNGLCFHRKMVTPEENGLSIILNI